MEEKEEVEDAEEKPVEPDWTRDNGVTATFSMERIKKMSMILVFFNWNYPPD